MRAQQWEWGNLFRGIFLTILDELGKKNGYNLTKAKENIPTKESRVKPLNSCCTCTPRGMEYERIWQPIRSACKSRNQGVSRCWDNEMSSVLGLWTDLPLDRTWRRKHNCRSTSLPASPCLVPRLVTAYQIPPNHKTKSKPNILAPSQNKNGYNWALYLVIWMRDMRSLFVDWRRIMFQQYLHFTSHSYHQAYPSSSSEHAAHSGRSAESAALGIHAVRERLILYYII